MLKYTFLNFGDVKKYLSSFRREDNLGVTINLIKRIFDFTAQQKKSLNDLSPYHINIWALYYL